MRTAVKQLPMAVTSVVGEAIRVRAEADEDDEDEKLGLFLLPKRMEEGRMVVRL